MLNNKYPLLARGVLVANHGGEGDPGEKAAILVAGGLLVNDLGDEIIAHEKLLVGSDMYRSVKDVSLAHLTGIQAKNKQQSFHCFFLSPAIPAGSNPAGGSLREAILQTHEFFARAVSRPWFSDLIATSCFIIKCDLFCFVCLLAA